MEIKNKLFDNGNLVVNEGFVDLLECNDLLTAEKLYNVESDSVKSVLKERGTSRAILRDKNGDDVETFIKRYSEPPLKEKIKLKIFFKPKTSDAFDEWNAIVDFHKNELGTMIPIAVGRFAGKTFNLTLGIQNYIRAAELFPSVKDDEERKNGLILKMAKYVGKMHRLGFTHQDLYLVHFFIKELEDDKFYLIDLQRTTRADTLSNRWHVKDLAQLLFSSHSWAKPEDVELFWNEYTKEYGVELRENTSFINSVKSKAQRILNRDRRKAGK